MKCDPPASLDGQHDKIMARMPVVEEHVEAGRGMLIVSLFLAITSALSIWVFHDTNVWIALVLAWMVSVLLCFAVNTRFGRWSLLGAPIAFSFLIVVTIACASGQGCL